MTDDKSLPSQPSESSPLQRIEVNYSIAQLSNSPFDTYASAFSPHIGTDKVFAEQFLTQLFKDREQDRQLVIDRQRQQFDLGSKELDSKTKLDTVRETRLAQGSKSSRNTTRLIIGVVTFAFTAALGYGALNKDSSLADKVFTGAMGLLGDEGV